MSFRCIVTKTHREPPFLRWRDIPYHKSHPPRSSCWDGTRPVASLQRWLGTGVKPRCFPSCGVGHACSSDLMPGPGAPCAVGWPRKRKKSPPFSSVSSPGISIFRALCNRHHSLIPEDFCHTRRNHLSEQSF